MIDAWSLSLLHSIWELALVALILGLVRAIAGRARAHARYAAGCVALLAALVLPLVTFFRFRASASSSVDLGAEANPIVPWIAVVWAIGVELMTIRIAIGLGRIRRIVREARPLELKWRDRFELLAQKIAPGRSIRWLAVQQVSVPMTVGWVRPLILLPVSALSGMPVSALELLVAHELAHVRRFDYLVNLAQSLVEAIYFFHPAIWWISARVREDREECCDDVVVAHCRDPLAYARALTELEECRHTGGALMVAARGGKLMKRIERLLETSVPARQSAAWLIGSAVALVLLAGAVFTNACANHDPSPRVTMAWLPPAISLHRPLIESTAQRYNIDANLLAVMVLVESSGQANARSEAGARGLMQLMPATAARIARERNLDYLEDRLDDPAYNLDLGAFYLSKQIAEFSRAPNPLELAVAAYNAGPKRIGAWLSGTEQLPKETEHYKELIASLVRGDEQTYEAWRAPIRARFTEAAFQEIADPSLAMVGTDPEGFGLRAPEGTPVKAARVGVVERVTADQGDGQTVVVRHRGGFETRYSRLGSVATHETATLSTGDLVGTVGSRDARFELRDLGEVIDPATLNARRER